MESEGAAHLRARGLRVTAQRLAVLRAVPTGQHVTADAVAQAARAEVGAISLQAVYDALNALVEAGLVRRIQPAGSPALFEPRVGDNHHHVVCRTCARVTDVDCHLGAAPCLTPSGDGGFLIEEAEVMYWGRCPQCRAELPGEGATAATTPLATAPLATTPPASEAVTPQRPANPDPRP